MQQTQTEQQQNNISDITLKSELQLIKALNKLYKEKDPIDRLNISEMGDYKGYISDCNVFMFIPKTQQIKQIFNRFTDKNFKQCQNVPDLKYINKTDEFFKDRENTARYNTKLLIQILECFKGVFETVNISLLNNYPVKLECEYFTFILAPRIEN